MDNLGALTRLLSTELRNRVDGYVERCETLLAEIAALRDARCIAMLLPLLDDNAEYDEPMFSIIHVIESFDGRTYVREILANIEQFLRRSPRWATIVHIRILNSPPTLRAYAEQIRACSTAEKQAIQNVLTAVRQRNATFHVRCDELIANL